MISKLLHPFVRYLDPADSLSEILYGLIMVLTILLTAGWYVEGSANPAQALLVAAIGCNVAWGLIDGVMYIVTSMYARGTGNRLIKAIHSAGDKGVALSVIQNQIGTAVGELLTPNELQRVSSAVFQLGQHAQPTRIRVARDDIMGGIACFLLSFVATLPATIPFLLIGNWIVALRVSNLVTVIMMFIVGYRWAKYADANPLRTGLWLALIGVVLVLIAVALGG